jgi:hypothetical protein
MRNTCHRLDVVHDGRSSKRTFDRRKRRLDSRPSSLAFQAFD